MFDVRPPRNQPGVLHLQPTQKLPSQCRLPWHFSEGWTREKHTVTTDTNCYGTLLQSNSPYLRCDIATNLDHICLVLLGAWGMHMPSLVLAVVSDASSALSIGLEEELLKGISDVAIASDACILTDCYRENAVSRLIGEVIYKRRVKNPELSFRAVGVGKWGNIRDRPSDDEKKQQESNFFSPISTIGNPVWRARPARYTLETNLTHYIFFDDGTHDSIDTGQFALALAKQVSSGALRKVPLVTVLLGGGLYAVESICKNLKDKTPVVIVDQSGPLANLMCKYLRLTNGEGTAGVDQKKDKHPQAQNANTNAGDSKKDAINALMLSQTVYKDGLSTVLKEFGDTRDEMLKDLRELYEIVRQQERLLIGKRLPVGELLNTDEEKTFFKYVEWFATCLSPDHRGHLHVFKLTSADTFQNKIYTALMQARENLTRGANKGVTMADEQMHLAIRWGITDVTNSQLIRSAMDSRDRNKIEQNRTLLFHALSKNLPVFVNNFVKLGINFPALFTDSDDPGEKKTDSGWSRGYLKELYSDQIRPNADSLYLIDAVMEKSTFRRETDLTVLLRKLVGDFMIPIYQFESSTGKTQVAPTKSKPKLDDEQIYRDLFLWCVVTHRLDIAKIFLGQLKTRICSALLASKILKSLVGYAGDHAAQDKLNSEADEFEMHAIECLRYSYWYDREQACELIARDIKLYGEVTCLRVAIAADDKKFLYEDACNALLTNIWYDKVNPTQERFRLTVNLLTMGFSQIAFSVYDRHIANSESRREDVKATPRKSTKRPLRYNGINYTNDYSTDDSIWQQFWHFHNRPIAKYYYTAIGYFLFLLFFSYYMLFAFDPTTNTVPGIHWTESLTIIFVTTMLFEEIRAAYFQDDWTLLSKFLTYFDWNNRLSNSCLVLPSYFLFYLGLILRLAIKDTNTFAAARIVMAYDLELWFIRSILFIGVAPKLGPKLVMIRKMANDLLFFIYLITVVILGYGITSRAMIAYGTFAFDGRQFFINVVSPVYYFVLGSFDGEVNTFNASPNAGTTIATHVMFAFHMLFVNILLVNLLIALFNFKINNVQDKANYIWAYDRCELIRNYYTRPPFFPPITLGFSLFAFTRWCYQQISGKHRDMRCFKIIANDPTVDSAWSEFERYSTNDYVRRLIDGQTTVTSKAVATDAGNALADVNESKQSKSNPDLDKTHSETSERPSMVGVLVTDLQTQVAQMQKQFDTVISSLDSMKNALARVEKASVDPPAGKQKQSRPISSVERPKSSISNVGHRPPPQRQTPPGVQSPTKIAVKVNDTRSAIDNGSNDDENV